MPSQLSFGVATIPSCGIMGTSFRTMKCISGVLLFLCLARESTANCPRTNCCSMTRAQLESCRGRTNICPAQTTSVATIDRNSCTECALGTCRLPWSGACVCPTQFLKTSSYHRSCSSSHDSTWPTSAGKHELDRRRCWDKSKATVDKCPVKDCCAMSNAELTACRGISNKCPSKNTVSKVDKNTCDECPRGTCRVPSTGNCICPEHFIGSSFSKRLQEGCKASHDKQWPQSAGAIDIDRRRCYENTPAASKCEVKDCCAMSRTELNNCRGTSDKCPSDSPPLAVDRRSCTNCPAGTCREPSSGDCLCPENFLNGRASMHKKCKASHTVTWPASVGNVDIDRRKCWDKNFRNTSSCGIKDCCTMSEAELTRCRGVHEKCPDTGTILRLLGSKCEECPQGTCRVPGQGICVCPEYFLASNSYSKNCKSSHGAIWPSSVGKVDSDPERKNCAGRKYRLDGTLEGGPTREELLQKRQGGSGGLIGGIVGAAILLALIFSFFWCWCRTGKTTTTYVRTEPVPTVVVNVNN